MKLYPKLAWDGIRKNRRLYLPYILTCIAMIAMQYIITYLSKSPFLANMSGGASITSMLSFGTYVMSLFSLIFLFYTSSFLSRRRKKEFGLYNILGMGKRNIGRILIWETLITAAISLLAGLLVGIGLSKLAELILVNIMKQAVSYDFSISPYALQFTLILFAVIFFLILINMVIRVRVSNPIALLNSEATGEKPPKANWVLGVLGVLLLAAAYYLAVTVKDPIAALGVFFIAVLLVIVATYLVFVASSVVFCRILQKNKKYYYKKNHFISVSSMAYRMKRNGAGLASICILATMVLVTLSATTTLYVGEESSLNSRYPTQFCAEARMKSTAELTEENTAAIRAEMEKVCSDEGAQLTNVYDFRYYALAGQIRGDTVELDQSKLGSMDLTGVCEIYVLPLSDYNRIEGANETLEAGQALMYVINGEYEHNEIELLRGNRLSIKAQLESFSATNGVAVVSAFTTIYLIVPDMEQAMGELMQIRDSYGNSCIAPSWDFGFDTQLDKQQQLLLGSKLVKAVSRIEESNENGIASLYIDSRESNSADFRGTYGGLFFLGILLSIVFLMAAVLIIYYKQISEGYEDQSRFGIMQKVGMTKKEIKRSINSQMLTVFFLPLAAAGVHLAFAFPMIRRLLVLFNLNNVTLYALVTLGSFAIFALFYVIVYRITANAYYNIVSGAKE